MSIQDFQTIPVHYLRRAAGALRFEIAAVDEALVRNRASGNAKGVELLETELQEIKRALFEIMSAPVSHQEVEA